ncbi:hypothetical protein D3C81_1205510 [compost metagenome]
MGNAIDGGQRCRDRRCAGETRHAPHVGYGQDSAGRVRNEAGKLQTRAGDELGSGNRFALIELRRRDEQVVAAQRTEQLIIGGLRRCQPCALDDRQQLLRNTITPTGRNQRPWLARQ